MKIIETLRAAVVASFFVSAVTSMGKGQVRLTGQISSGLRDTSLIDAVLLSIRDSAKTRGDAEIEFDARPLRSDTAIQHLSADVFAHVSTKAVQDRADHAAHIGVRPGNGDIPLRCPSVALAVRPETDQSGCPPNQLVIVNLSVPSGLITSYRDTATIRATELHIGPHGWTVESYDYVMRRLWNRWLLVARVVAAVYE